MLLCPYCNSVAELKDSAIVYGKSYGPIWMCSKYPTCDAYCGCHPGTEKPLGRLANKELREAKKRAHAKFDPIWKQKLMPRGKAYYELAKRLGVKGIHIGESDVETCKKIERIAEDMWHEATRSEGE